MSEKRIPKKVFPINPPSQPVRIRADQMLRRAAGVNNLSNEGQQQQAQANYNDDDEGSPNTIAAR